MYCLLKMSHPCFGFSATAGIKLLHLDRLMFLIKKGIFGLIIVTFTCIDETTLPRLFTTMAHPHLEYGNLIWCPMFRRDN